MLLGVMEMADRARSPKERHVQVLHAHRRFRRRRAGTARHERGRRERYRRRPARVPACPSGSVCLWPGQNYTGAPYVWYPGHGNVFLGDRSAALVDHVGSFVARTSACFIDTGSDAEGDFHGTRRASSGDFSSAYLGRFGNVMDRIAGIRYC